MEYLGELGRLVPLRCASAERVQAAARYVDRVTVEGRRRVQVVPASPRTWDVSWDLAYVDEVSALAPFLTGAWGSGSWHWVSVDAWQGNLLTPTEADLTGVAYNDRWSLGGPMRRENGDWSGQSLAVSVQSGSHVVIEGIPVLPGRAVTYGADVQASDPSVAPRLHVQWLDAAGGFIAHQYRGGQAKGGVQRVAVTFTPPANAASARLLLDGSVARYTAPQVTWTPHEVPYAPGHGCRSAVVDGMTRDLLYAADARRGSYSSIGFTVMEVG